MREIKFRVWNKTKQAMEYPVIFCIPQGKEVGGWEEIIPMQFTGLKDSYGKDVFEGDICQYKTGEKKGGIYSDEYIFTGFVRYDDAGFEIGNHNGYGGEWESLSFIIGSYNKMATNFKVIGNIYENTELINI